MKKFYVTTSIPYANAPAHIGFALEIVQADVLARYHRLLGYDVWFLTGTDEHGLKTLKAARKAGKEPEAFVNEISENFKALKKILNLSNDDFIKTTDKKRHKPALEKLWKKLSEKGDIYKKKYKGFYCSGCEAFVTKKDLIGGKCPNHQKKPELVEEENYFFRLSNYLDKVKKLIKLNKLKIVPESRKKEILSITIGDVSFSRAKEKYWGFQVPGDKSQILYVWCDALPNYISAIGYAKNTEQFRKYWPADVHCIGKDIIKFHAIFWPAMLLSAGLALPKTIFVHGFISVNGQKMSKSLGNVIDPFKLVEKYGTDAVRYYLLREISPFEDGDFTYEKFEARYNGDLASGIGNLLSRVRSMAEKTGFKDSASRSILAEIKKTKKKYEKAINGFKFNEALKAVWDLMSFSDKYIDKNRPWEEKKESKEVISDLLIILDNISLMLEPFLPETAQKILKELERKNKKFKRKRGGLLFPRI